MGVYIKNMEIPKSCDVCPFIAEADDYHVCYINWQFIPWKWIDEHSAEQRHSKPSWCPLIHVQSHGRLIDADALAMSDRMVGKLMMFGGEYVYTQTEIDNAPTIIEAEESET